jgi:hypothetical protein
MFARTWALSICLAVQLAVAVWSFPAVGQDDPLRHGHALIVGTWEYSDPQWPRLDDVHLQIQQLEVALKPHFDDVQLLLNPTFDQLDAGLRRFLRTLGNDDNARLFIYYAGHGYTEVNSGRNEYRGYITGADTPYVDGTQSSFAAARVKALSMEAVRGLVSDVNARQVLFVFDSCFAGTIFAARSPAPHRQLSNDDITRIMKEPVREFITAGDIQERIPAHSPLPQLLVNALEGAADPYGLGVVTGQQISQYLWSQTRGLGISPREGKLPGGYFDRGEFLFRTNLFRPPPSPASSLVLPNESLQGDTVPLPPASSQSRQRASVNIGSLARPLGKFEDWTAATHLESGQTVCYIFTRAQSSAPSIPGRGGVVLTVTERSSGRDAIAIEAGLAYAPNATVTVQVDQTGLEFYTSGRNAFARDGKAAVTAFGKGARAIARSPSPKEVTDTFSLKGFGQAYAAIVKACPAK